MSAKNPARIEADDSRAVPDSIRAAEWKVVERFLVRCRDKRNWKPSTLRSYRETLRYLFEWSEPVSLFGMSVDELLDFVGRTRYKAGGVFAVPAPATLRRESVTVATFYSWCQTFAADHAAQLPELFYAELDDWDRGRTDVNMPRPVGDTEFLALWDVAVDYDRFFLGMAFLLGYRTEEVASLKPEMFDLDRGIIGDVMRKGDWKNLHTLGYRDVLIEDYSYLHQFRPIAYELWEEHIPAFVKVALSGGLRFVAPHVEGEEVQINRTQKMWFPTRGEHGWYRKRLTTLKRLAGLEFEVAKMHRLRSSAATNLFRTGLYWEEVANILNHKDTNMTRKYLETNPQWKKEHERNRMKRAQRAAAEEEQE